MVGEEWDQLVGAYPSLNDQPTSLLSPHSGSDEEGDNPDMESRVESIGARFTAVEEALTELPELVEKATADVQSFMDDEYSRVRSWVEEGLERTAREAETKHCIGVTHSVLDEHIVRTCVLCVCSNVKWENCIY